MNDNHLGTAALRPWRGSVIEEMGNIYGVLGRCSPSLHPGNEVVEALKVAAAWRATAHGTFSRGDSPV